MPNTAYQALLTLDADALAREIYEAKKALFDLRLKKAMRQVEDTSQFKKLRHKIAQLNAVLTQRAQSA
jgi:large subunit ribosomal protein L29